MTQFLFSNNASSTLRTDLGAGSLAITLPTGEGAKYPSPGGGQACVLTIEDRRSGRMEIVWMTARSTDVLTVVRGQEGTSDQNFLAGAIISCRVTKGVLEYLQSLIASAGGYDIATADARFVHLAGDTLTGALTLFGAPTLSLHAATKAYADLKLPLAGGTLTGALTLAGNPSGVLDAAPKQYVDLRVLKAGDSMSGPLVLSGAPTLSNHAATKQYVDGQVAAGGTFVDAPTDGVTYGRLNNAWAATIADAPSDNSYYTRRNAAWAVMPAGIADAPNDGVYYARRNTTWTNIATVFAPLANPSFTGVPVAATPVVDTNTTQLATTAFVLAQAGSATPLINGTAAAGSSTRFARQDHVHPVDSTRAALANPSFSGVPTAPTAAADNFSGQLATTAFVINQASAITPIGNGAAAIGSSLRYARADHVHPTDATRAPLASPAFSGTPTGATAAQDTNTTQLATTAFVVAQAGGATPLINGSAAVGTSLRYARQDHVHPTDTTRAPLASPALTGVPSAPTAAVDSNSTQLATTAYVVGQGYAKLAGPTLSGMVTLTGTLALTAVNADIEIGALGSANTPVIDAHSSGFAGNDYDARIVFSGGSNGVNGAGLMNVLAANLAVNSNVVWHGGNLLVSTYMLSFVQQTSALAVRIGLSVGSPAGTWGSGNTYNHFDVVFFGSSQGAVTNQGLYISLQNTNTNKNPETQAAWWVPWFVMPLSAGTGGGGGPP